MLNLAERVEERFVLAYRFRFVDRNRAMTDAGLLSLTPWHAGDSPERKQPDRAVVCDDGEVPGG